jgi:putative iron-regulated protein
MRRAGPNARSEPMLSRPVLLFLGFWILLGVRTALGHAVFDAPRQFKKPNASLAIDFRPQAESFIRFCYQAQSAAARGAANLNLAVVAFLDQPDEAHLENARQAWRDARPAYQRTEMLRFFNGPIDHPAGAGIAAGPEARINAWPVNEASIDAVRGAPNSGLVFRDSGKLTRQQILDADQVADESDVSTGWHAIEFLLWGQDFSTEGPGERPATDFLPGEPYRERRRDYLRILAEMLLEDLDSLTQAWDPDRSDSYAHWLSDQPPIEALGRGIHGAASLAAIEIYGQRLTAPLDSGSQEDEHSCFSDNTLQDLRSNLEGIQFFVNARYDDKTFGASLMDLLKWKDPALAARLGRALARAGSDLASIPEPFDKVLSSSQDAPERALAETAAESVRQVAVALKAAAETLGIDIVVPGV